jgi:hypothetical protein
MEGQSLALTGAVGLMITYGGKNGIPPIKVTTSFKTPKRTTQDWSAILNTLLIGSNFENPKFNAVGHVMRFTLDPPSTGTFDKVQPAISIVSSRCPWSASSMK